MQSKQILGLTAAFLAISTISNLKLSQAATITVLVIDSMATQQIVPGDPRTTRIINPLPLRRGKPFTIFTFFNYDRKIDSMNTPKELTYDPEKERIATMRMIERLPLLTLPIKEVIRYSWDGLSMDWLENSRDLSTQSFPLFKTTITNKVVAIPEPLTILGASTAIGFGTYFKRKLSEKTKNKA